jgi:hypothetical protein
MRKIITPTVFFLCSPVHERGFGVAAFRFEAGKPAFNKRPGFPADSAPMALPQERKS